MTEPTGFLYALAVVAIAGAGLSAIVGITSLRDRLFGAAIVLVVLALAVPIVGRALGAVVRIFTGEAEVAGSSTYFVTNLLESNSLLVSSAGDPVIAAGAAVPDAVMLVAFLVGHLAFAVYLLRRRISGDRAEVAAELERARGRERPRLPPEGEEPEA